MKRKFLLLILLLLQVSVCITFAVTKKEAQSLVEARRYEEAVKVLQSLISQPAFSRDADCNKWLGQSLCLTGRFAESVPYLEFAVKQNRRSGAQWYLAITLQHLYDFEGAMDALEEYRPVLHSEMWLEKADSLEAEIQQGLRAMEHVQDVVIIDSLSVPREAFFSYYRLGSESGRVLKDEDGRFFENQASDYRIHAIDNELYQCHKIQETWEEKDLLPGLGSDAFRVIDPFLRGDGETLYFACDSTPGIGGLDIYKTKYNTEEGHFYMPERLGMPFNSPYDDYLLAIDETHLVGWWATDRNQDPDNVTIYLFKFDEDPQYLDEPSIGRARIDNIADTWQQEGGYADLVASVMNAEQVAVVKELSSIVISDDKLYSHEDMFRSARAKAAYNQSSSLKLRLQETIEQLEELRERYKDSSAVQKKQLTDQILQLEERQIRLNDQITAQIKLYRRLEQ